ncbi:inosine-5-monophosphate dehydrogenase [Sorangium cellulosum]|uniref:Inosine-5-monophosphate dehydrogenase n=2 Tax=Sorangium cellulosum TaxID=56 RepID=A0A150PMI6_SORCE|nr:IMP dehydrogenase [Sorangium cellulosum]AGP33110.1 inosine 5'-monophosphate dehydrogenase [Sorangium cellulosum So0157-2]KYF56904.1 inosine-5-monophosphate dehydrogenase [Sorangium cellulosum]
MAFIYDEPSRTFGEYLLVPNLTTKDCVPANVDLTAPVARFKADRSAGPPDPRLAPLTISVPITSAMMQSVSGADLAIALARCGGLSFVYGSQGIEEEAAMVRRVKNYKAGFVVSDSNLRPEATLGDVLALTDRTGHSTIAITEDGTPTGRFVGIITSRDYRLGKTPLSTPVREIMTPFKSIHCGKVGIDLQEANELIWRHKLNTLPVIDERQHLQYLVFRKDYESHQAHPLENVDHEKRLIVGAGINSRDYRERVPALVEAGADVLCIDSSDGYSEWQRDTIAFVKSQGKPIYIGAGNVVDREGFLYLVESGADFVKVGIGGGSICITREQKGIGRGQASAVIEVAKARDEYFQRTGVYVPICSDGGISQDYHITIALAMGADFVMMGRYFARFDEAPGRKVRVNNQFMKEYWGEGSNRARNWQRYDHGDSSKKKDQLEFEEGVDSYVPYAGKLKDNLDVTLAKVRSTMCNCGAISLRDLYMRARLTVASAVSIHEGGVHDVMLKDTRSSPREA